jgi:hypothetical protein
VSSAVGPRFQSLLFDGELGGVAESSPVASNFWPSSSRFAGVVAFSMNFYRWAVGSVSLWWALTASGGGQPWPELDPAEWVRTASPIDPEAAAEYLVRDVRIDGVGRSDCRYDYFRRIRIYEERAVAELAILDLPQSHGDRVRGA